MGNLVTKTKSIICNFLCHKAKFFPLFTSWGKTKILHDRQIVDWQVAMLSKPRKAILPWTLNFQP